MTDWGLLRDAYGPAGSIGSLLAQADSGDEEVWEELWPRLCHQGTVYSASHAALPPLAEIARRWRLSSFNQALFLATAIIASTDGPESPSAVRAEYPEAVSTLHQLAESLPPGATDDTDFVYKVQALIATESDSVWASRLDFLANEEAEFPCTRCGDQILVGLEESPATAAVFGDTSSAPRPVQPADPDKLTGAESRAYSLAVTCGRTKVASQMLNLFGSLDCPRCDSTMTVAAALE